MVVYLTSGTICWAFADEYGTTYFKIISHTANRWVDGRLSATSFPKALLEYQVKKMLKELDVNYCPECLIGRWGFKSAMSDGTVNKFEKTL